MVPIAFHGTRGARGVRLVSHHGTRDELAGVYPPALKIISVVPTEIPADDAKCGTVVPQQVDLFVRWEVWRHTELGCMRNRKLGGQQRR